MTRDLTRLLRPRSIAVIGGGAWARAVIRQSRGMGFDGALWPVNPKGGAVEGVAVHPSLADLPAAPDAAFVGVNRHATIETVAALAASGAGGAVCFAAGFAEAAAEDGEGVALQAALVAAAGGMPILGPNCYGLINALDGALLWPDQHGLVRCGRGVAILSQSSNLAINLTMARRAVPVAYVVTCGNQAQTGQAEIARALLDDPRVTAIGLHVEGFGDLRAWEALAEAASARRVPMVAMKLGRSAEAQRATVSHTAALIGSDAGAAALLDRLGIARVDTPAALLETLKLLHVHGPLETADIASISCSGGEASLVADLGAARGLTFPALAPRQRDDLRAALGPMVALANPLDYNTYIWRDTAAMTAAWGAMAAGPQALTLSVVDYPREDRCDPADWDCCTEAVIGAAARGRMALVSSLPELLPEPVAERLIASGVAPLNGLAEALDAVAAAARSGRTGTAEAPLLLPGPDRPARTLDEAAAKARLADHGVPVPRGRVCASAAEAGAAAAGIGTRLALKVLGYDHKSEAGAVALSLAPEEVPARAATLPDGPLLVEEMIEGAVAELLVGVVRDPAHGFVLTLAAGGVLAELLDDRACLLVPASRTSVAGALAGLRVARQLDGWRGRPAADREAVLDAVMAVQAAVLDSGGRIVELEVNPLICTPDRAVAADALLREVE